MDDLYYDQAAFLCASDDENSMADTGITEQTSKAGKINLAQTPMKSNLSKKEKKGSKTSYGKFIGDAILEALNTLVSNWIHRLQS